MNGKRRSESEHLMRRRNISFEIAEERCLLSASTAAFESGQEVQACFAQEWFPRAGALQLDEIQAIGTEPQFRIHQPPRIQLGNAPLPGSNAYQGKDQIEVMWQTVPAGNGTEDSFIAQLRDPNETQDWNSARSTDRIETRVEGRIIHSAVFHNLEWNTFYEYRVLHMRGEAIVDEYSSIFKTRLEPGDSTPFTFAAYGDSSVPGEPLENFRAVQKTINESPAEFSVLLGDNIYDSGTHQEADARFTPEMNPEATEWIASHVDYFAIGNHELFGSGAASLDSFSMPIPEAGVNAFAEPAEGEIAEFYGSFDYGDVHFVTFDSNTAELSKGTNRVERMEQQAEFLVANLDASTAKWKIVFMHHPMVGSAKLTLYPNTDYLEVLMPRLVEAGVDLVMTGDSHTYAWTYPIVGLDDSNNDGEIADSEVVFDDRSPFEFEKGSGVVQLISGAGGRKLRTDRFGQPVMAQAHSLAASTHPLDFGHAEISVTSEAMEVRYISSETGLVVGDHNKNGVRDDDEEYFAAFRIVANNTKLPGDVNRDGLIDVEDLNAICSAILAADHASHFDVNQDGVVSYADQLHHAEVYFGATPGDANLDGVVNSSDLVLVFQTSRYEQPDGPQATWQQGDWNCDGRFTTRDLVVVFELGVFQRF